MVATAEALIRCDCCAASRPAAELFRPYAGATRCRDAAACQRRMTYEGTGMEPPAFDPPAPVSANRPVTCDFCKTPRPVPELYRPIPGGPLHRCRDVAACQRRTVETLFSAAQRDDFPEVAVTTSAGLRHAARDAGAPPVPAAVPAEVAEARQTAAQTDHMRDLAADARRR